MSTKYERKKYELPQKEIERQQKVNEQIIALIRHCQTKNIRFPKAELVGKALGFKGTSAINRYIKGLEEEGIIKSVGSGKYRNLYIAEENW